MPKDPSDILNTYICINTMLPKNRTLPIATIDSPGARTPLGGRMKQLLGAVV